MLTTNSPIIVILFLINNTMGSLTTNNHEKHRIAIIMVPFPAQGHLNQSLQLSCLLSSAAPDIPIHYVGSAVHNRQAQVRANGLNPNSVAKIHFHDLPIPPFESPAPNPNSAHKFPAQLQPAFDATLSMRQPLANYARRLAEKFRRVVIVHDPLIAAVVQDAAGIPNAESYAFNCLSAFCEVKFGFEQLAGLPPPLQRLRDLPPISTTISDGLQKFLDQQKAALAYRSGDLFNTCRLLEAPFLDILESKEIAGDKKSWAIGPLLPAKLETMPDREKFKFFGWLDEQKPNSVLYVTFGTTTSLSDEQIAELAHGLEKSGQKFLWVLRDADRANVFAGEVRTAALPAGFEERTAGTGIVVREWAPQPEILSHPATGGFMSHCGWNSCIESITMGVPMAAWPMHSDQPTNAVLVTEIFKMGILVVDGGGGGEIVRSKTIADVVRRLMAGEEGNVVRKKAGELASTVRTAAAEGGVSRRELETFIRHIER